MNASVRNDDAVGAERRARLRAVLGGTAAALAVYLVGTALGVHIGIPVGGTGDQQPLTAVPVAFVALLAGLAGWGLAALVERAVPRWARTAWLAAAVVMLVVSFLPLAAVHGGTGAVVVDALLHLAVAVVVVPLVARTLPARRAAG